MIAKREAVAPVSHAREFRERAESNDEIYQTTHNGALAFAPPSQS
jgi:hypothetical protein